MGRASCSNDSFRNRKIREVKVRCTKEPTKTFDCKLQATKPQFLQNSQLMHEALSTASSQMRSGNSQSMSNKYADSLMYAPNLPEGRTCIMHLLHCWAVVLFALSVCSVLSVPAVQCLTTGKLHDLGCELNLSRRQQVHHQSISSPRSMLVLTIDSRRGTEI